MLRAVPSRASSGARSARSAYRPGLRETATIAVTYVAVSLPLLLLIEGRTTEVVVAPEAGYALAIAWLRGPRAWAGIWVGACVTVSHWALTRGRLPPTVGLAAAVLLANLVRALVTVAAARWLARRGRPDRLVRRPRAMLEYALVAGVALPIAAIAPLAAALASLGAADGSRTHTLLHFAIGESAGYLIAGPAFLAMRGALVPPGRRALEAVACAAAIGLAAWFVFGASTGHPPLHFLLPFLLWATLRFLANGAIAGVALATLVALVIVPLRVEDPELGEALGRLQVALEVLAVTFLLLAATLEDRRAARLALAQERELLASRVADRTAAVRRERDRARAILETIGAAVMVVDRDARVQDVNPAFVAATAWSLEELQGVDAHELRPEAERELARAKFDRILAGDFVHSTDAHLVTRRGDLIDVEFSSAAVPGPGGTIATVLLTAIDVSELVRTRRELERSASLLRATLEATADGVLVVDRHDRNVVYNQRFARLFNLPVALLTAGGPTEATRFLAQRLADPTAFASRLSWLREHLDEETADEIELTDGSRIARLSRPYREGGRLVGRVSNFRDVTRQRLAERERDRLIAAEGNARRATEWAALAAREAARSRDSFLFVAARALHPPVRSLRESLEPLLATGAPDTLARLPAAVGLSLARLTDVQHTVARLLAAFPDTYRPDVRDRD